MILLFSNNSPPYLSGTPFESREVAHFEEPRKFRSRRLKVSYYTDHSVRFIVLFLLVSTMTWILA